jgi:hydrogenase expression/formation protein HypE
MNDLITLAHGGGGKAMKDLLQEIFFPFFDSDGEEDQARLESSLLSNVGSKLAFTTDSFVVDPLEFPGGDIGNLAVCGTVNDLSVGGAQPLWLSASFIIEEGFSKALLLKIVKSMRQSATEAGVKIVTGDTKVVERGKADKLFITTAGVGVIPPGLDLSASKVRQGDLIVVNGYLGDHGATVLTARDQFSLQSDLQTDCKPLNHLMKMVLEVCPSIRCARDATRGGLSSVLNEIALSSNARLMIDERLVKLRPEVRGICEILGLDPLYLANEGALVLFVPKEEIDKVLRVMQSIPAGAESAVIGEVIELDSKPRVEMRTELGGTRIVDMLLGEQLPRIC